jgi:hypothetical protein
VAVAIALARVSSLVSPEAIVSSVTATGRRYDPDGSAVKILA